MSLLSKLIWLNMNVGELVSLKQPTFTVRPWEFAPLHFYCFHRHEFNYETDENEPTRERVIELHFLPVSEWLRIRAHAERAYERRETADE